MVDLPTSYRIHCHFQWYAIAISFFHKSPYLKKVCLNTIYPNLSQLYTIPHNASYTLRLYVSQRLPDLPAASAPPLHHAPQISSFPVHRRPCGHRPTQLGSSHWPWADRLPIGPGTGCSLRTGVGQVCVFLLGS